MKVQIEDLFHEVADLGGELASDILTSTALMRLHEEKWSRFWHLICRPTVLLTETSDTLQRAPWAGSSPRERAAAHIGWEHCWDAGEWAPFT